MSISFFKNDFLSFNRNINHYNMYSFSEKEDNLLSFSNSNILIQKQFYDSFTGKEEDNLNDFNNVFVPENINEEINVDYDEKKNICEDSNKKEENVVKKEKNKNFPIVLTRIGIVRKKEKKDFKKNKQEKKNSTEETACSTEKNEQLNLSDKINNKEMKNSLEEKKQEMNDLNNDNKEDIKNNNDNQLIDNEEIEINLDNSDNYNENEDTNKLLNKKRKMDIFEFNANKFIRRTKILTLDSSFIFINEKIRNIYNNDIGRGIITKQFLPIDKKKISHSRAGLDKEFLNKKMKDILSDRISEKITNFLPTHNKELIDKLINDKENGGDYFKELFDLKFVDYLRHINGTQHLEILNGLMKVDEIMKYKEFKIDKDEIPNYEKYFENYEWLIMNKSSRNRKIIKS